MRNNRPTISVRDDQPTPTASHEDGERRALTAALNALFEMAAARHRDYKLIAALLDTIVEFVIEAQGDIFVPDPATRTRGAPTAGPRGSSVESSELRPAFRARIEAVIDSWSDDETAWRLGIGVRQVRRRAHQGKLHFFEIGKRRRYPLWQFDSHGEVLPALTDVARKFPSSWGPEHAQCFMTGHGSGLRLHGEPLSPAEWLLLGNEPSRVVALIATSRVT